MNREYQDKLWNELSEESKKHILSINKELDEEYEKCEKESEDRLASSRLERLIMLEQLFGEHNLNPKPPTPKTWEDLIDNEKFEEIDSTYVELEDFLINKDMDNKLRNKILATYQIHQLIDLGYGGMVSEEEWKDTDIEKWCIIPCNNINDIQRVVFYFHSDKRFIAFHTEQQAEEFMSHESNKKLVEQYYMM